MNTVNDIFRKDYKSISDDQKNLILEIKTRAEDLYRQYEKDVSFSPREMALAKTKLEESVMWAVKSLT